MAITSVNLMDAEGSVDPMGQPTYVSRYLVESNSKNDGPAAVLTAPGIPSRGAAWSYGAENDGATLMRTKKAKLVKQVDSLTTWVVTCTYNRSFTELTGASLENVSNPLLVPAEWGGGTVPYTRAFTKDREGNPIKNSAGDPFVSPPIEGDDSRISIKCTKNFSSALIQSFTNYKDAINSVPFWSFEAKRVKVQSMDWTQLYWENSPYVRASIEVVVTESSTVTWDEEVLDAGFRDTSGRIKTKPGGAFVSTPWPLNGSGVALTQAQINSGSESYIEAKKYQLRDLNAIGFPTVLGALS